MQKYRFIFFFLALTLVYLNHFDNGFHFDDTHCVENNLFIRDIKNLPKFFTDATTFSSLPANQGYRPLMTTFFSIDYFLGDGLNPVNFHITTFFWFLLQLYFMFRIFRILFHKTGIALNGSWLSFAAVVFYGLHTANAETINYISARSDSISTSFLVISFFIFLRYPEKRTQFLYLIPLIAGVLVKPAALVFPGLIFSYLLFFESDKDSGKNIFSIKNIGRTFTQALPSLILCGSLYWFQSYMTPKTFVPGNDPFYFAITQPFVSLHYFVTFFIPYNLSADTDWTVLSGIGDPRFWIGVSFLIILLALIILTSGKNKLKPVAFGLSWFIIALLPSSSIVPLAEVLNDHRTFFPYIGLTIALFGISGVFIQKLRKEELWNKAPGKMVVALFFMAILSHSYGTYLRNEVWDNNLNLWQDVSEKSPGNGRGLMNYGIALMENGNLEKAEGYFEQALKIIPEYPYLHINYGLLILRKEQPEKAEIYYKNAVKLGNNNPESHYYYGHFLSTQNRTQEAIAHLKQSITLSPAHLNSRYLLMKIYHDQENFDELAQLSSGTLKLLPEDEKASYYFLESKKGEGKIKKLEELCLNNPTPEAYIELSLAYYKANRFLDCIAASQKSISLRQENPEAWNNICSALNRLSRFEEAIVACKNSLAINPDFEHAWNNLSIAEKGSEYILNAERLADQSNSPEGFIELSLVYFNLGLYEKTIASCKKALSLKPENPQAYNNICSAYNRLGKFQLAEEACVMALKYAPEWELAKNNLSYARQGIQQQKD